MHSTIALSGGDRYRPATSRTFSTKYGSVESLNVSARCGLSPNARQIRPTADGDNPLARAIRRVLQWVALVGRVSSVRVTTRSTSASVTVRGAPGRGSSVSPSSRRATNRLRHVPTVAAQTPSRSATALLEVSPAQARTIRARRARRWVLLGRLAQRVRAWRSSSESTNSGFGRAIPPPFLGGSSEPAGTGQHDGLCQGLLTQDTSGQSSRSMAHLAVRVHTRKVPGNANSFHHHTLRTIAIR